MLAMEFFMRGREATHFASNRVVRMCVLTAMACSLAKPALASEWVHGTSNFNRHAYISTGIGYSHLDPDTSEVDEEVDEPVSPAGQITIGLDVKKWLSLELHSADLGSAGLTPQRRINYQVHGASSLFYIGKNRKRHARHGLSVYGRLGLGYLENSAVGDVEFQLDNPVHVLFGAGVEYASSMGLGVRADFFSFDNDVSYSQLALVYRFGRKQAEHVIAANQVVEKATTQSNPVPPVMPALVVVHQDDDGDGVVNELDQCPTTAPKITVNKIGCAFFHGIAEGLNFYPNSTQLTREAKLKLNQIAKFLLKHNNMNTTIRAHTDDWGEAAYNQALSEYRAKVVVDYLSRQGVMPSRLAAQAFGESYPIATNRTAAGRKRNRRVEIIVQQQPS